MFRRLDKFDGPIFGGDGGGEGVRIYGGGLLFGVLTGLCTWGAYIRGGGLVYGWWGALTGFYGTLINALDYFNLE